MDNKTWYEFGFSHFTSDDIKATGKKMKQIQTNKQNALKSRKTITPLNVMKHGNIRNIGKSHCQKKWATRPPSVEPWCSILAKLRLRVLKETNFICHNCNLRHSDEARKCDILRQKVSRGLFVVRSSGGQKKNLVIYSLNTCSRSYSKKQHD